MLDPRAIAVQGIGFGSQLTAVQGLLPAKSAAQAVSGGGTMFEKKPRRLDRDDDVLLFLLK